MTEGIAENILAQVLQEHEALRDIVGERTLEILEQRRLRKTHHRGWLVRRYLLTADLVGLLVAFVLAQASFAGTDPGAFDARTELLFFVATLPAWIVIARFYGLYSQDDQRTNHLTIDEAANVFHMVTVCTWLFFAFTWLTGVAHPAVSKLLLFWVLAVVAVPLHRTAARSLARTRPGYVQNTVIVGAGTVGQAVAEKLLRHPEYGVHLVGFIDSDPTEGGYRGLTVLGSPDRLPAVIRAFDIERVIIAFSQDKHERVLSMIRSLKDDFVQVDVVPRYFELISPSTGISSIEGVPVLCLPPRALGLSARFLKRMMDLVLSTLAMVFLTPFFLIVAAAIKLDTRGPVFFWQPRVGVGGREFSMVKFRTMVEDADQQKDLVMELNKHASHDARMFKATNDPRITRVGRFLRRFSIDELPQLVNVLRGQMSLVGPRPLIPSEDAQVADWGRGRLNLKPGMTGLWQVLGRSEIPFGEMVRLDYLYVTTWSPWQDLKLICSTVPLMLRGGRGAY